MIYEDLTFEERLHNAIGAQEIDQIKAKHAYLHGMGYSKEEWDTVWYRGDDVTWAHFFGRMVGFEQVWYGSVVNPERGYYDRYCSHIQKWKGASYFDARSVGCTALHCLASAVIEIAKDGKTGRACYLTPGTMMARMPGRGDERDGGFLWERYGSDFAYDEQDGNWYYFHEHVCPDFGSSYGTSNWGRGLYEKETGKGGFPGGLGAGPGPEGPGSGDDKPKTKSEMLGGPPCTDPGPLHNDLALTQTVQNTVPWPEPYETLDDDNSYAPGRNDITKRYSALKSIVGLT